MARLLLEKRGYGFLAPILGSGAGVNKANDQGWTPLISASHSGHAEIVQLLLKKGADVKATATVKGADMTALEAAKIRNKEEIVKMLKDAGAKR